jgi:polar amino acid transport system substrate-binding protein
MLPITRSLPHLILLLLTLLSLPVQADLLDDIQKRGNMRVGVSLFVPWAMQDDTGQLYGSEIDIAKKLAQDIGIKPEFKIYNWEDIIPALIKGEIDVIISGMSITPARALKLNFSLPYSDSGITLATNTEKTKHINKLEELNHPDIIIAGVEETVSVAAARQLFNKAKVSPFKTAEEAQQALLQGSAHVYIASIPQPQFLAHRYPDKIDIPLARPLLTDKVGMAIRKGDQEWLNFLNTWVIARQADKWLSATHKYWFGSLKWQKGAAK